MSCIECICIMGFFEIYVMVYRIIALYITVIIWIMWIGLDKCVLSPTLGVY
jgi:hypothetical protein